MMWKQELDVPHLTIRWMVPEKGALTIYVKDTGPAIWEYGSRGRLMGRSLWIPLA